MESAYNIDNVSKEQISKWKTEINNYIADNDFENAFFTFVMRITRLSSLQRECFIEYYKDMFKSRTTNMPV
jgi:hypothetical protein